MSTLLRFFNYQYGNVRIRNGLGLSRRMSVSHEDVDDQLKRSLPSNRLSEEDHGLQPRKVGLERTSCHQNNKGKGSFVIFSSFVHCFIFDLHNNRMKLKLPPFEERRPRKSKLPLKNKGKVNLVSMKMLQHTNHIKQKVKLKLQDRKGASC